VDIWYAGVDWGTQSHRLVVVDDSGGVVQEAAIVHSAEGLNRLVAVLEKVSGGRLESVHVAIEVPRGAVVETLLERGCQVFVLNPKQVDRFRDRYSMSGAKDDRRDALVLADSLRTDSRCYRRVQPDPEAVVRLRGAVRLRSELAEEEARLSNRLREQLMRYWPQILELGGTDESWIWDLLDKVPTPEIAATFPRGQVTKLLQKKRIRRLTPDAVVAVLRSRTMHVAPGTTEAASHHALSLIERLRVTCTQTRRCEKDIDSILAEMTSEDAEGEASDRRDIEILQSFPGAGRVVVSTAVAEARQNLRDRDYHGLRALSGQAPVTKQSGKSRYVIRRWACNPRLQWAMYHWARVAMRDDVYMAALYKQARDRGKSHGTALRIVGDRLLARLCAALRSGTLYDPKHRERTQAEAA
jgi:transposase